MTRGATQDILRIVDPLVELLDRQVDFLLRREDSTEFLIQVEPFLTALRTEPRLAAYLDDVLEEVVEIVEAMEAVDEELSLELIALRRELVELHPDADDSDLKPPPNSGSREERVQARLSYERSLARFDEWAARAPDAFNADGRGGRARKLLGILRSKDAEYLHGLETATAGKRETEAGVEGTPEEAPPPATADQTAPAPDRLDPWRRRLGNVQRRYDYAVRLLRLRTRTSPGVALLKLEAVPELLNPPPRLVDEDGDEALSDPGDVINWASSASDSLFKLAWRQNLDAADRGIIDTRVAELRDAAERLREDLRRRIGATRSRPALMNRFKLRCEWHDRDRMLTVADDSRLPGGPDDRLTAEVARYLFDAGLSPLTRSLLGALQSDLLDPLASFYVEARQFASSSARADIVNGIKQVLDTVGRLRGGPYAVDEAFCVVFRRGGPYIDLPAVIQTETHRLYLVLVDLASTTDAERQQRDRPMHIPVDEFLESSSGS